MAGTAAGRCAGVAVQPPAGPRLSDTGRGSGAAPLFLCGAAGGARKPKCRQHPRGGQLPDDPLAGRLAADQDHPDHRHRADAGDGLRDAVRGEDVLEGGAGGRLFGRGTLQRRHSQSGKGSRAAPGRPGHPHRRDRDGGQRRRQSGAGSSAGAGGGGRVYPERRTAPHDACAGLGCGGRAVAGH